MRWKILLALSLFPLYSCKQPVKEVIIHESARVKVAKVSYEKMSLPIRSSGLVVSTKEVKLSFKTGGIIAAIYAEDGAIVKKGQLLATLNQSEIEAFVTQAANGYDKAVRDYNRAKNLFADSVVTLEQFQNAETAMNMAKANLEIATFNLNHTKIYAPDKGVILKRLVEANEVIAPGYPVFLFGTTGKQWKIRAGLADRDFVRIIPGDSARVMLDAYPGVIFYAIVSQIGEAANPLTGTYEIELELLPCKQRLASGFVANLEIFPSRTEALYLVPVGALIEADGQTAYVYFVSDSLTAEKLKISIVGIVGSSAAVKGGFGNVSEVVTDGAAYLTQGEHVTVVR
jgi:multidrug efflux system membrane fusion protein